MSTEVTLPALGESVTEGTVSRWLKQVGDTIETDEALLEVSTDKVDTEIPSPTSGTLLEIRVAEDETVEVGAVLAVIGDEGEGGDSSDDSSDAGADEDQGSSDESDTEPTEEQADEPEQADEEPESAPDDEPAQESAPSGDEGSGSSGGQASGTEVTLPELGESVTEGTVSRWLKQVGDTVEADEALLEISTDKVDTEIPSPTAGTLLEIRAAEDETVEVGAVLAVIGEAGSGDAPAEEAAEPAKAEAKQEPAKQEPAKESPKADSAEVSEQAAAGDEGGQAPVPTPQSDQPKSDQAKSDQAKSDQPKLAPKAAPRASSGGSEPYVTPLVRKLAQQHGVDLSTVSGTGVGGRVRKQDIVAAAEEAKKAAQAPAPAAAAPAAQATAPEPSAEATALRGTTEKMSRIRKTIATRMVDSLHISAQLSATVEVDLTRISQLRNKVKAEFARTEGAKLTHLSFITKAVVETLKVFPQVNAQIDTEAGTITYSDAENIGLAVDTEKGLMVPVIKAAGDLNIAGIAKKIGDLGNRSRNGGLMPDDLTGGTFTITNYGSVGTLFDTPIINQPQVAILGTGALVKRPVVMTHPQLGDTIAIREMMYLSLTYDHRLVDGAVAGRFLSALKARLEEGEFEAEFGL